MTNKSKQPLSARRSSGSPLLTALALGLIASVAAVGQSAVRQTNALRNLAEAASGKANPVLEWNQIFIDTLIATNTANSSSQRLGAIVHTAIFDAYNGIDQRYSPIFVHDMASRGASRRAAVIAAGHTALLGLFPARQTQLDALYMRLLLQH
jgi:hypothetical protein